MATVRSSPENSRIKTNKAPLINNAENKITVDPLHGLLSVKNTGPGK